MAVESKSNRSCNRRLTVGIVGREESSEWLVRRTPQRPQKVVTAPIVGAVVGARRAGDVDRVRTVVWVGLRQRLVFQHRVRILLQHLRHQLQQLADLGVRQ